MGYMDQSGTTYFSPPTCTTDLLNEVDKYLPNDDINIDENMSKINENIYKWLNNTTFDNIFSNYDEVKKIYLNFIFIFYSIFFK